MPTYFKFEVSLLEVKPRIWRSFLLHSDTTFMDLHEAIQSACGWWNYHLFLFRRATTDVPGAHPAGAILAGAPSDEDIDTYGKPVPDARRKRLSLYFGKGNAQSCAYEYDFGDGWLHEVKWLERVSLPETFVRRLLGGERAFPHEDCGGIDGYERCVELIKTWEDPQEDEPIELLHWLDGWDPEKFDFALTKKYFDANWHVPIKGEPVRAEAELEKMARRQPGGLRKKRGQGKARL